MAIKFKEVSYIYDEKMPFKNVALDNINLEIEEHKITAIIGHTGSGKSTLIQHLNALLTPTIGEVEILDYHLVKEKNKKLKKLRSQVGLVFQFAESQLFEETVLKDVCFGPKNFGLSDEECKEKAINALKLVGIDESLFDQNPLNLSGGQKRRVALAGIIAINPEIIVLDEPTSGLDPQGSKDIIALFKKIHQQTNKTIIIVSHDNDLVYELCDNIVLMDHKKLIHTSECKSFFSNLDLINKYNIVLPEILQFKKLLQEQGFKLSSEDSLQEIVESIRIQINEKY